MMVYVYAVVLTLVNLLCLVGILFGLPGTWLMVLFPVLLKWWQPDQLMISWTYSEWQRAWPCSERCSSSCWVRRGGGARGAPHGAQCWPLLAVSSAGSWGQGCQYRSWAPCWAPASGPLSARCSGTCG